MKLTPAALATAVLALTMSDAAFADRLVAPPAEPVPTFQTTGLEMVAFGGYVYFAANDGVVGNELWRTDGTPAGTTLVQDFNVGNASASGNPRQLTVVGTRMFLIATTTASPYAAFTIDQGGTPQPTSVTGGEAGTQSTGGTMMGSVNGKGLLYHYDGLGGSNKLYGLGSSGSVFSPITVGSFNVDSNAGIATVGGYAYYGQTDGNNSAFEPYRTNGTTTARVKDIVAGINGSQPSDFIATGNRAYFTADDGVHGRELWVTDGTDGGTQIVHEHHPLNTATSITSWAVNGNVLYYIPNDPTTGQEVWRTEGTEATTRVVKDLTPGPGGQGAQIFPFKDGFGMLRGSDVYASDGTDAGTTLVGSVDGDGYGPAYPTVVGSKFYFRGGFSGYGSVVWRSDGTPAGTFALTAGAFDSDPRSPFPFAGPFAQLGDKITFTAQYPHAAGDPVSLNARRIYVIDTSQADETRRATTAPSITGTPALGQKLTGDKGAWTLEPNTYAYKWLRNGTPVPNATTTSYTVSAADAGAQITFRVTASGIGGPNVVSVDSAPAGASASPAPSPVSPVAPVSHATPALAVKKAAKLTGTARVGQTIKLRLPRFAQSKVKLSFRWYAGGKLIKKQTKSSLKLTKALKGKRITAKITVRRAGYRTLTLTVGPTGKVKSARR